MASDYDKLVAIRRFLKRTKTQEQIEAIELEAFSKIQDGVTIMNVSFEGGQGSGAINCDPHILLNACEDILEELGVSEPQKNVVFTQFCGTRIAT